MERAAELGGFYAAHGLWFIAEGEPLVPLLGQDTPVQGQDILRFRGDDPEQAVARACAHLDANPHGVERAILVHDGQFESDGGTAEALIAMVRCYREPRSTLVIALPYRRAQPGQDFGLLRPRVLGWEGEPRPNWHALMGAFFRGFQMHTAAAQVWAENEGEP
ncbi:hypothetical protein Psesu_2818 [Pseudoxanthomonas suwonensis 11-1]|jgi:hypothetical protein|uniref:Uncharacterized protein n=1 Tax=Pseudoxanthomonas suwonensis (strain 11-1) TaxID=743721 RepID=E6WWU5_PSEUU|nr:hypothetical protein [Pseudoxanthomonas suwonensis]ADV28644.1 hypothetical protein Psesu_2818 [Pseudoxanthomonas suwonensis 11-1]